jgi:hypothetical protein
VCVPPPFPGGAVPSQGLLNLAPACTAWLAVGVDVVEWPRMASEGALGTHGFMAAHLRLYATAAARGFGANSNEVSLLQR